MSLDSDELETPSEQALKQVQAENEVDAEVEELLRRPADLSQEVPAEKIPWLPHGAGIFGKAVRLFCFYGVGSDADNFGQWLRILHRRNSESLIRICPVELPGHGAYRGWSSGNVHEVADKFVLDVIDRLAEDQRPFALFGFCIGARLAYEVARRRQPVRLYIIGRAAPHIGGFGKDAALRHFPNSDSTEMRADPAATLRWTSMEYGGGGILATERLIAAAEQEGNFEQLQQMAKVLWDDIDLGHSLPRDFDAAGRRLRKAIRCRLHIYIGRYDNVWTLDEMADSWSGYQTAGQPHTTICELGHAELCSADGGSVLDSVLEDLETLCRAARAAV